MPRLLAGFAGLLLAAPLALAQLPPDKALASLTVADGLQVELFAAEPMLINPTSMDIDHKGRVWVAEAVNYRRKNFNRPILRAEGDRIQVLTDKDGDGKADEAVTFYQAPDLYGPLGVCVAPYPDGKGQKVFVCQSPDILVFEDRDGDLKADGPPAKFLTGFQGFDHDHGVHGLNIGPDGKLYFTVGDSGVKDLQSSDGKGKKWTTNTTDVQKGTVWRCDFDGKNLELIAHNFRNNYECCVNSFGEVWLSDNDDDGNQQTRICFVMPGGNYGYGPRGPGQSHWHEEQPGIVHKTLRTGFGSPTGICFYEGTLLPKRFHGQLLHTDAGPRELRAFHIQAKGAGHALTKENMLTSTDNWFRLSDVCVAPDGSVFVCDWYDPGVGGHGMGDWTRGRVYRVTPKGYTGYKVPEVKLDTKEGVLQAFQSPNLATRHVAKARIEEMKPAEIFPGMGRLFKATEDWTLRGRMMWVVYQKQHTANDIGEFMFNIHSTGPAVLAEYKLEHQLFRTVANEALSRRNRPSDGETPRNDRSDYTGTFEGDDLIGGRNALIRLRLAPVSIVMSPVTTDPGAQFGAGKRTVPLFYMLAKRYDGQDIFYRAALNIACGTDPARRDAILADFDKHFPEWNDTVADLVWELRPKSMIPRMEKLLVDSRVTAAKGRIVDILAVSDDPAAGKTMLTILKTDAPAEVKARALEHLRAFLPTRWSALRTGKDLDAAIDDLLGNDATQVAGLQLVAAAGAVGSVERVCDLIAGVNTDARLEAVRTLGRLRHKKAVEQLAKAMELHPLEPMRAESIRSLGLLAAGPPKEAVAEQALATLKDALIRPRVSSGLRTDVLAALAGTRAGTQWLLELAEKKQLPPTLTADTGRLLRNSPFQGERNKAMLLFPAPGKLDLAKLAPIAELAKRKGDAANGQAILARSVTSEVQCLKCHTVRGLGGQIGPDLSMIGKKGSRENLFESVLQPAKAVADQYVNWKIDTADGQSLNGLIVGETPQAVTLRDANGKDYTVAVKDIDKRTKLTTSLMPDNLAQTLTEDELIDVVEYMVTLQTPSLTPESWHVIGPFRSPGGNEGLGYTYGPEAGAFDAKATFPEWNGPSSGPKPKDLAWRVVRPGANGYVDLAALHGPAANNSVSYAYKEVESPEDQEATLLLGTDDGGRLWVNGKEVFNETVTRAAAPDQNRVTVRLKKGKNEVLLKVANGNSPHGFYLTILSAQELKAK